MDDSLHYLKGCMSKPKTLAELDVGDVFIFFPSDGDDSGHGGFRSGARLFQKIESHWPGGNWHESVRNTCREYERPEIISTMPDSRPVIRVWGIDRYS